MAQQKRDAAHLDLEAIKTRVLEMEEEANKLKGYEGKRQLTGSFYAVMHDWRVDADNRSVYVGNVDYGATADELEIHFNSCGPVNRVTILCDRFTGHPKGFAYIEFSDSNSVRSAVSLDETLFRGRMIKVLPKRTNISAPLTGAACRVDIRRDKVSMQVTGFGADIAG